MIDLHAHVVLEGVLGRAGDLGPELIDDPDCPTFRVGEYVLEGVRYRDSPFMDVDLRLARMSEMRVSYNKKKNENHGVRKHKKSSFDDLGNKSK